MKSTKILAFLLCINISIYAQDPGILILNTSYSGTQVKTARDAVILNPGFSYTPSAGNSFTANTSPEIILGASYTGTFDTPPPGTIITSTLPGYNIGNADVNSSGGAIYTIPMKLPDGTGGMVPDLAVTYNSQAGNGLLGVGFSLSGLSAITLINLPYYAKGETGITSYLDRQFALDGNRLVLISGTHATNGAVYKTENETFSTITFYGIFGSGTEWFEVKTKDGKTIEYGRTANSKINFGASTSSLAFYINKTSDQFGNYLLYNYERLPTYPNQPYLRNIQYTGNSATGLQPYNTITFLYDKRTDNIYNYMRGYPIDQSLLLRGIRITVDNNIFKEYSFKYYFNQYSYLDEIREIGSDGSILTSLMVDRYAAPTNPFSMEGTTLNLQNKKFFPGDFNGDGMIDIITIPDKANWNSSDTWELLINNNGNYVPTDNGVVGPNFKGLTIGDYDSDGIDEIFFETFETIQYETNCRPCDEPLEGIVASELAIKNIIPVEPDTCCDLYSYTLNSFVAHKFINNDLIQTYNKRDLYNQSDDREMRLGDLDGDGINDYVFLDDNNNIVKVQGVVVNTLPNLGNPSHLFIGDFNGNGLNDIIAIVSNYYIDTYEYNPTTKLFTSSRKNFGYILSDSEDIAPGDFNGDGLTDLVVGRIDESAVPLAKYLTTILFSTGTNFISSTGPEFQRPVLVEVPSTVTYSPWNPGLFAVDFNLDGKSDILAQNYQYAVYKSTGEIAGQFSVYYNRLFVSNGLQFINLATYNHELDFSKAIDANFDGTPEFYCAYDSYDQRILSILKDDQHNLVKEITNSSNMGVRFTYNLMAGSQAYYHEEETLNFPLQHIMYPARIVSRLELIDKNLGKTMKDLHFHYSNLKAHRQGRGILGFSSVSSMNLITGDSTFTRYNYHPSLYIIYSEQSKFFINNNPVSEIVYTPTFIQLDDNRRYFTYTSETLNNNRIDNIFEKTSVNYDSYGNLTQRITQNLDASSSVVRSVTENMSSFNSFGFPGNLVVNSTSEGVTISRSKSLIYYSHGLPKIVTANYGSSPSVVSSFDYDSFGNMLSESVATGSVTKIKSFTYEPGKGRFLLTSTNHLGETTTYENDPVTGNQMRVKDFNNLQTSYNYDGAGRVTKIINPDSTIISITRGWSNNALGIGELFYEETSSPGKPTTMIYLNQSDRALRTKTTSFSGRYIQTDSEYDIQGRLTKKYQSYFEGDDRPQYTSFSYDTYGRIQTQTIMPNNVVTNYYYSPLRKSYSFAGRSYEAEMNAAGQKIRVAEPGGVITYHYNPEGQIDRVESPSGVTSIEYDDYGFQKKLHDIDAGTILYNYNGHGELLDQTDAKGNKVIFGYDSKRRIKTETWNTGLIKTYDYHPTNGQISKTYTNEGPEISFLYDNLIRVSSVTQKADAQNIFTRAFTYNDKGDIETIVTNSKVTERYTYNTFGYQDQVFVNDFLVWKGNSQNKYGVIDNFTLRNNNESTVIGYDIYGMPQSLVTNGSSNLQNWTYVFDPVTGNMSSRKGRNTIGGLVTESFLYDNQDRLYQYQVGSNSYSITYDPAGVGNILFKTDVGNYGYGRRTHAPDSIISPTTLMTSLPDQTLTYTPYNKTLNLSQTSGTNIKEVTWTYAPDQQRTKQVITSDGNTVSTKFYAFGNFEKEVAGSSTRELYYVSSPSGTVAVIEVTPTQTTYYYIHSDLLGSFDVITNHNGVIVEMNNFDPWGRRRNPLDWSYNNVSSSLVLGRGFTGHEHLNDFGLINMNGRIYDPILASFLSPDNYVQTPDQTQNFNRYAYCLNNPLAYTDPDGEFFVPMLIGSAISLVTNGIGNVLDDRPFFQGAGRAALTGAIGGAVSFGIGQSTMGMAGIDKIANQAFAHGLLGGSMSYMGGGTFGSGFVSGAFGSLAAAGSGALLSKFNSAAFQSIGMIGSGAVVGGLGAKIEGGDFWDGFRNGAISSALNHTLHDGDPKLVQIRDKIINSRFARFLVKDYYSVSLDGAVVPGFGASLSTITVNFLLRGNEKGLFVTHSPSTSVGFRGGLSITFQQGTYVGNPNDITRNSLYGRTWSLDSDFPLFPFGGWFGFNSNNQIVWKGTSSSLGFAYGVSLNRSWIFPGWPK
jgi:RHS repeat-associated protein